MDYDYATLGEACQTSASILTDNSKYLPVESQVYDILPTITYQYPNDTYYGSLFVNRGSGKKPDVFVEQYVKEPKNTGCSTCGMR